MDLWFSLSLTDEEHQFKKRNESTESWRWQVIPVETSWVEGKWSSRTGEGSYCVTAGEAKWVSRGGYPDGEENAADIAV